MLAIFLLLSGALVAQGLTDMTEVFVWSNLEYGFESPFEYQYAIENGLYNETGFKRPYDVGIHVQKNRAVRVFTSTPRVVPGIPYTLATISSEMGQYGPKLMPYPNYESHSEHDVPTCDRIISVFRFFVDPCKRLWVVDTGRNFFVNPTQVCPPKIIVYDLNTDNVIFKYVIPEGQYIPNQTVHNGIIVDVYDAPPKGQCKKGKAYITDARGWSLLVFDLEQRTSWMIQNELFKPDPAYITTTIAGESFEFPDGLYTSTPYRRNDQIYLHSHASLYEIAAPLSQVNNQSMWINNPSGNQDVFKVIGSRQTQSPSQTKDARGNIYFSIYEPTSILSWNPSNSYEVSNFKTVVENPETLQFVAGLKVAYNTKKEEVLLALSIRLQKLNTGTISLEEDNFRLMVCKISTLQSGRGKCGNL